MTQPSNSVQDNAKNKHINKKNSLFKARKC